MVIDLTKPMSSGERAVASRIAAVVLRETSLVAMETVAKSAYDEGGAFAGYVGMCAASIEAKCALALKDEFGALSVHLYSDGRYTSIAIQTNRR